MSLSKETISETKVVTETVLVVGCDNCDTKMPVDSIYYFAADILDRSPDYSRFRLEPGWAVLTIRGTQYEADQNQVLCPSCTPRPNRSGT